MAAQIIEGRCQSCYNKHEIAHSSKEKTERAQPGHFIVCTFCGQVYVLDNELKYQKATRENMDWLKKNYPYIYTDLAIMLLQIKIKINQN